MVGLSRERVWECERSEQVRGVGELSPVTLFSVPTEYFFCALLPVPTRSWGRVLGWEDSGRILRLSPWK